MKIHINYHKDGLWRFKLRFNQYWHKKIWIFGFWRIALTLDFRKNWIRDMVSKNNDFVPLSIAFLKNNPHIKCDMFVGPCACGATHTAKDWLVENIRRTYD